MAFFDHKVEIFGSHVIFNRVTQCIGVTCIVIIVSIYCGQSVYYHRSKQMEKQIKHMQSNTSQNSQNSSTETKKKVQKPIKKNLSALPKNMYYYIRLARFLTVFVQFIFLVFLMLFTLNFFAIFENNCDLMAKIAVTIWNIARFSLYYLLVLRIKIAFGNSLFGYRNRTF
eukprot:304958_1